MEDRIQLTIEDGIADVRLNHAAKMNALDPAMFLAIAELGVRLKHDQSLRAIVVCTDNLNAGVAVMKSAQDGA
jgi:enoyl-CoA hydratase/carnithine racemase